MKKVYCLVLLLLGGCAGTERHIPLTAHHRTATECRNCEKICIAVSDRTTLYKDRSYTLHAQQAIIDELRHSLSAQFQTEIYPRCSIDSMLLRLTKMDVVLEFDSFFWPVLGWSLRLSLEMETYAGGTTRTFRASSDFLGNVRRDFSVPPVEEVARTAFPAGVEQASCRVAQALLKASTNQCEPKRP
jgi:hypothetical protein